MKGYIYICKMKHEGNTYYKIGRTLDLGKRELELRTANPFLDMIAKKTSFSYEKEEKEIHHELKKYHFTREWYELPNDVFQEIFVNHCFEMYAETERLMNIKNANKKDNRRENADFYRVFKKTKIIGGKRTFRWYYWFYGDNGKQIQKACKGCKNRNEAENYISRLAKSV